jgi:hypothetical protein
MVAPLFSEEERTNAMSGRAIADTTGSCRIGCGVMSGHVFYTYDGELLTFDGNILKPNQEPEYEPEELDAEEAVDYEGMGDLSGDPGRVFWRDLLRLHPVLCILIS